jgi:hypothetical protein
MAEQASFEAWRAALVAQSEAQAALFRQARQQIEAAVSAAARAASSSPGATP